MSKDDNTAEALRQRRSVLAERRDEYIRWLEGWDRRNSSPQAAIDWALTIMRLNETINEIGYVLAATKEGA